MFGLFFDKINSRRKKSEEKPKEVSPRVQPKTNGSPVNTTSPSGPRINSLSPTSHNTQQFYFPQYSPQSTSSQNYFKANPEPKKTTQIPSNFPKKIDETNTHIITTQNQDAMKKEKPKPKPNFLFQPLDKDSFTHNMGSITESTQEGTKLAQNLPPPKSITASKIPTRILKKEDPHNMVFKVKNKDTGEVFDIRDANHKKEVESADIKNKHGISLSRRQQAWQDWWNERKKNNYLLLEHAKFGDVDACIKLLDKKKGDLKADANSKGDNDWTPLHFACLNGNKELVNLLLYNEANIDAETTLKFTPLIIASQKGHEEIVQLLINTGVEINCKDVYNNTPLHYAAQNGHKKNCPDFVEQTQH
jgi:ankyrin repeat protein